MKFGYGEILYLDDELGREGGRGCGWCCSREA